MQAGLGGMEALRILIVEDEFLLAMDLESHLQELGQEVVGLAADTEQALALAGTHIPDLALVDINLRDGRTGTEIASELVSRHQTTAVFLTGNPEHIPVHYAGAIGSITKPWHMPAIEQLIMFVRAFRNPRPGSILLPPGSMLLAPHLQTAGLVPQSRYFAEDMSFEIGV